MTRFQPGGTFGIAACEARDGVARKSPLVAFGEAVMVRAPIDPPGLREKLDQWIKGVWVDHVAENGGNIVVTPHGAVTGKSARRLAAELRCQPDLAKVAKASVSDPALSEAKLPKLLPATVPIRLEGGSEVAHSHEEDAGPCQL